VLADGIPLNDPFGGWVYWNRVPRESINEIEVLRGVGSHLYGSTAAGGVINIISRQPITTQAQLNLSYGNKNTPDGSLFLSSTKNGWSASLAGELFNSDGYIIVAPDERGPIDTNAGARYASGTVRIARSLRHAELFGAASYLGESRLNGTPLQTNRTHLRQFAFGADWSNENAGLLTFRASGGTQLFDQNFTAINATRSAETLTRVQRTPAQVLRLSAQWSRSFGQAQTLVAGGDWREVRGASNELAYLNGRASSLIGAGGRERSSGFYFEDVLKFDGRVFLTVGARIDRWKNYRGLSTTTPLSNLNSVLSVFADRDETAFSPYLSALFRVNDRLSITGSASRAFRAPTLNELYRSFRVGNVLTLANEDLRAEQVSGYEAGVRINLWQDRAILRTNLFWDTTNGPVSNVTLSSTPLLITRQRQNLGSSRSRGVELDLDARLSRAWTMSAGYMLADASVVEFPGNPALEGRRIPQVPRHQFTFQLSYSSARFLTWAVQGRGSSSQFDDDLNQFRLKGYFNLDTYVARSLNKRLEAYLAVENLLNQRYEVGKTPVTTIGPPLLVRAGLRVQLTKK
jgi:outer membrane receptor protein involved in Fe transport